MIDYEVSEHAYEMLRERNIEEAWVKLAVENPDTKEAKDDGTVHYVRAIEEIWGTAFACCDESGFHTSESDNRFLRSQNKGEAMRLKVDHKNDALYFRLDESAIVESEEVKPGVILDYDANDNVVGVEMLGLSKRVPAEMLKSLQFDTA